MKTQIIDNSCEKELNKCITWQFESSEKLIGIVQTAIDFSNNYIRDFWDSYIKDIANIDTATDFGLSVIGIKLNIPRPIVLIDNERKSISTELYRAILKAKVKLLEGNGSIAEYKEYIASVFGVDNVMVVDNLDMSISFAINITNTLSDEQKAVIEQCKDIIFAYPAGVRTNDVGDGIIFGLDGQQKNGSVVYSDIGTFGKATFAREV
jgi:hypothetical protein